MRLLLVTVALVGAARAAKNAYHGSGPWYGSVKSWSLARYPRMGDVAMIVKDSAVTFDAKDEPGYMTGASQGDAVFLQQDAVLNIADNSNFNIGVQDNEPLHCVVAPWEQWSSCSVSNNPGTQKRTRVITQPRYGGNVCTTSITSETRACNTHNVFEPASGSWYRSRQQWSYDRIPRHMDKVMIKPGVSVTVDVADKPDYFTTGTSDGFVLEVWADGQQGGMVKVIEGSVLTVGASTHAPVDCKVHSTFSEWGPCSKACGGGTQKRTQKLTPPTYGGEVCPAPKIETQQCNTHPCGCTTASGFKPHGSVYPGHGKNFCNQCRCSASTEHCTERDCGTYSSHKVCDKTRCVYGPRFNGAPVQPMAAAIQQHGARSTWKDYEMATAVYHNVNDSNGKHFSCSHSAHTGKCVCYCSDQGKSHIWHHTPAQRRTNVDTDAGCKCAKNWQHQGKTYNGCQNPKDVHNPYHGKHGPKHTDWCIIDRNTCPPSRAVTAGVHWDTCGARKHFKLTLKN